MTKTLTEQWREGTLPQGWYYMLDCDGKEWFRYLSGIKPDADFVKCFKEVLGPVPSYDEIKRLQEQLKEANEILMMPDNIKYHDEVVEMLNNYMEKCGLK